MVISQFYWRTGRENLFFKHFEHHSLRVELLRIVNGMQHKELGRWTGKRFSPMELTPRAQAGTTEDVGKSLVSMTHQLRSANQLYRLKFLPCG